MQDVCHIFYTYYARTKKKQKRIKFIRFASLASSSSASSVGVGFGCPRLLTKWRNDDGDPFFSQCVICMRKSGKLNSIVILLGFVFSYGFCCCCCGCYVCMCCAFAHFMLARNDWDWSNLSRLWRQQRRLCIWIGRCAVDLFIQNLSTQSIVCMTITIPFWSTVR